MNVQSPTPRRTLIIVLISIILIVLMGIHLDRIDRMLSKSAYTLLDGMERLVHPVQEWLCHRQTVPLLLQQLTVSEQERLRLASEVAHLNGMLCELRAQGPLREFCARYNPEQYHVGRVIKTITTRDEQYLILDSGARDGVEVGMIAVTHNCLIGRVHTVFSAHALVVLITDKRSKIPVQCAATGTSGIYSGTNRSDEGELLFVSHLDAIQADDMIMTSGEGSTYPAGFCVGKVAHVSLNPRSLHYRISVTFYCDLTRLTHVALLKN